MRASAAARFADQAGGEWPLAASGPARPGAVDWASLVSWCRRNPQAGRVSVDRDLILEVAATLEATDRPDVGPRFTRAV